jgi:predicted HAD superfamily Cof-like phosphohydrolase
VTLWTDVADWNTAVDVRMLPTPGWVPDNEIELAVRLIDEEFEELKLAVARWDLVEVADAIADGMYVVAGLLLRLGLARYYIGDTGLLRDPTNPPTWNRFPITGGAVMDQLVKSHEELFDAVWSRNLIATDVTAHRIMYLLSELALVLSIPLKSAWGAVHLSNMAKLVDGKAIRRHDGKLLKPEGWQPPDIAGVLADHGWQAAA